MAGEMVERVARAMLETRNAVVSDETCDGVWTPSWDALSEKSRIDYCKMAAGAIAAMREPSEGMLLAGCAKAAEEQARVVEIHRKDVADIWQAMIDEALKP